MQDFEKLGLFYLGRLRNLQQQQTLNEPVLYDSKDLTTHAMCVGMTGSGKTGLCLSLLEEAAIDGIPAIAIDPKGDLGNLLLAFPNLLPEDFHPWVDQSEATRNGMTTDQYAKQTADRWKKGLADWNQQPERIDKFRSAVDISIYTPGSNAGFPLSVLRSLKAPPPELVNDSDAFRSLISSAVSGLLALLGIAADPIRSREHILMSNIVEQAWRAGRHLDMAGLIREIQAPSFKKIGFMDLETFIPLKDRFELAMSINNLLASPGFSSWMEGEPLNIQRLLYTAEGKPRLSILSIAHLSDDERMFFVTILLNEMISWMRAQSGTSSLRALLYMDEVFGYLPPTANPPSKLPMLTLLKQARAFGLGLVLSTQNPVDLDYKALSNMGTWFLGRLQTERDKARVLDGLEGASTSAGIHFDRKQLESILSGLGSREFLLNNVHEDEPIVFQTRWALSYLCGPLTRTQIQRLMEPRKQAMLKQGSTATTLDNKLVPDTQNTDDNRPVIPPGILELFLPVRKSSIQQSQLVYRPAIIAEGRVHFVKSTAKIDHWETVVLFLPVADELPDDIWEEADLFKNLDVEFMETPEENAAYSSLPVEMTSLKSYKSWTTRLKNFLYRGHELMVWKCKALKAASLPGESEGDFRARLATTAREQRDLEVERLRKKYASKFRTMQNKIHRAEQRIEREQAQSSSKWTRAAISFGSSLLGAMMGRKTMSATNINKAATSMRAASSALGEREDIQRAKASYDLLLDQKEELETKFQEETETIEERMNVQHIELDEISFSPRKSDITINRLALVWTPWTVNEDGIAEPVFEEFEN